MKLSRWFLVVVVVQILIGSAELPISRLQGRLRSCARSRFAWLQLAPMLLTLGLAALTSRFATFIPGALSTAVWRATSAVFSNAAHACGGRRPPCGAALRHRHRAWGRRAGV